MSAKDGAPPPPSVDPTLSDVDGGGDGHADIRAAETAGDFPDTAIGTQLVLYQTGDGAVELRWHVAPAAIAHARRVFPDPSARPLLRLLLTGADGGSARTLADAGLEDDGAATSGLAHYGGEDAEGRLVAEIGLATGDGGWLLIARSNGLYAAAPVGAAFVREQRGPEQGQPDARQPESALRPPDATWRDSPSGLGDPPAMVIEPEFPAEVPPPRAPPTPESSAAYPSEFPLIEPELSGLELTAPLALPLPLAQFATDAGEAAAAPATDAEPPPGGVVPRLRRSKPGAGSAGPDQSGAASTASGRPASDTEQASSRVEPPEPHRAVPAAPVGGSGPVLRAALDASLSAELLVRGSAPPNTLLDLGGHPYRVGPGGRFELRVPIRDPELIRRLLASLPRLPVAERDPD